MRLKPFVGMTLAALFTCAALQAIAQTVPAATESIPPLAVGGGFSSYSPDWSHVSMVGGVLWVDYTPGRLPAVLHGLGIELLGRDLTYASTWQINAHVHEKTIGGGVIYTWHHYRNIHPYAKFEDSIGGLNWDLYSASHHHSTGAIPGVGGGLELHAYRGVWLRGDYEYRFWSDPFTDTLAPSSFTVGATYHFGRSRRASHSPAY